MKYTSILQFVKKHYPYIILLIIAIAMIASSIVWVRKSSLDPHWDMGRHLWDSVVYYDHTFGYQYQIIPGAMVSQKSFVFIKDLQSFYTYWTSVYRYYPPFVYYVTGAFYKVFHSTSLATAILSNSFFVCLLLLFTYKFASLFVSKKSALLSSLFIITTPLVFSQLHEYMLEVPLLAVFVTSLYFLVTSKNFTNKRASILFGIVCAIGLMTKWTYILNVVPPLVWVLCLTGRDIYHALQKRSKKDMDYLTQVGTNLAFALILILLIAGPWYINNMGHLGQDLLLNAVAGKANPLKVGFAWLTFYINQIEAVQLYVVYFLILVAGVIYSLRIKELRSKFYFLYVSLLGGYFILTLINNKDPRYSVPLLIYMAIIAVSIFEAKLSKYVMYSGVAVFVVFAVFQAWYVGFSSPAEVDHSLTLGSNSILLYKNYGYTSGPPVTAGFPAKQAVTTVVTDYMTHRSDRLNLSLDIFNQNLNYKESSVYLKGDNDEFFNGYDIYYYIAQEKSSLFYDDQSSNAHVSDLVGLSSFDRGGYLILHFTNEAMNQEVLALLPKGFVVLTKTTIYDGTNVYVIRLADSAPPQMNLCTTPDPNIGEYTCAVSRPSAL
jgi:hypothetical protein